MRLLALLPVLALLAACGGGESAAALHLTIGLDLSGRVQSSAFVDAGPASPLESASVGVEWGERARLLFADGRFGSLRDVGPVALADLTVRGGQTDDGLSYLRIELPRGPQARWPGLMAVTDAERRRVLGEALRGSPPREVQVVVHAPAPVLSEGFQPEVAGLSSDRTERRATLTVSLEAALAEGDPILWHVTW